VLNFIAINRVAGRFPPWQDVETFYAFLATAIVAITWTYCRSFQ